MSAPAFKDILQGLLINYVKANMNPYTSQVSLRTAYLGKAIPLTPDEFVKLCDQAASSYVPDAWDIEGSAADVLMWKQKAEVRYADAYWGWVKADLPADASYQTPALIKWQQDERAKLGQ